MRKKFVCAIVALLAAFATVACAPSDTDKSVGGGDVQQEQENNSDGKESQGDGAIELPDIDL